MRSIIITGPQGSGKTTLARQIAAGYMNHAESELTLDNMSQWQTDIQVLIIDNIPPMSNHVRHFMDIVNREHFAFRIPYGRTTAKIRPLIIGIFQSDKKFTHKHIKNKSTLIFNLKSCD